MCSGPKREAKPSKENMETEAQKQSDGFLSKYSILLEFSASDDLESFKETVEETGLDVDEAGFWYGRRIGSRKMGFEERTPLMIASMYGSKRVMKYIIDSGKAQVNRATGSDKSTALHCAAAGGSPASLDAVRLLLEAAADPNLANAHGSRPVDLLAAPKKKSVETLLRGENEELEEELATVVSAKKEYPVDVSLPDINNGVYGTDDFRMYSFKIKPCSRAYSHDWTECPFVHPGENARRRDPRKYPYSCVPCPEFRKGSCLKGDTCEYAHGVFESWLHPAQYRTRLCKDETGCARKVCFFAHRTVELRPVYAATGSAMPSPRPTSDSTPPMSPKKNGAMWQNQTPPMLQLSGSRLKSALSARDFDLEMELLGLEASQAAGQNQKLMDEITRLSSPYNLNPTNLDDVFGAHLNSPTQLRSQLRSSYPSAATGLSSSPPIRSSSPSASALMSSRAAAFKQRSQSFVDRGAHNHMNNLGFTAAANSAMMSSPSMFSDWSSSPERKVDWAVQGDELSKLRKSASFGFRGNSNNNAGAPRILSEEPDVSWVNSLVKDAPAPAEKHQQNYHPLNQYNQMNRGSVHEVLPPWVEQLYIEQEQLVA